MNRIWLILMASGVLACPGIASAQAETTIVQYGESGWRFQEVHHGRGEGFQDAPEKPGFHSGTAPFGGGEDLGPGTCPLQAGIETRWLTDTDMLLRRTVVLPAGARNVKVNVVIDNNVVVFWNNHQVSFAERGGCPSRDNPVAISVDNDYLTKGGGDNLLALRAIDAGVESFVDVQVTGVLPDQTGPDLLVKSWECFRNPDNSLSMRIFIGNEGNRAAGAFNIETSFYMFADDPNQEPYARTTGGNQISSDGVPAHGVVSYVLPYIEQGNFDDPNDPNSDRKFLYHTQNVLVEIDKENAITDEIYKGNNSALFSCP